MKCLLCGESAWKIKEMEIYPIINSLEVKVTSIIFKCRSCGQTSMDDHLFNQFANKCVKEYIKFVDANKKTGDYENP